MLQARGGSALDPVFSFSSTKAAAGTGVATVAGPLWRGFAASPDQTLSRQKVEGLERKLAYILNTHGNTQHQRADFHAAAMPSRCAASLNRCRYHPPRFPCRSHR